MAPPGSAAAFLPQSLLRRVETHVRVMSFPDTFQHTTRHGPPGTENVLTVRAPEREKPSRQFAGFTRIHQNATTSLDNSLFYDDVLRKIVPAAMAGQSFTVLFCGAPSSGRSQTMYTIDSRRDGGAVTYGMLHHLAAELLDKKNVRVMVSAYHVRGHKVFDSRNDRPVPIRTLHSPLGPTPEVTSVLLEKPEDAMIVPNDKRTYGSCFVTFEIYHQMSIGPNTVDAAAATGATAATTTTNNGERRGAFSIITFVDVASFDDPLPPDVVALKGCISRQIAGSDPVFSTCRLSELLEASICRGRSLIGIATVVGAPASLFDRTCAVLDFVSLIGTIDQVATVCMFVHPKWLPDLPGAVRDLDAQHERRAQRNYERGVSEVYFALRRAFTAKLHAVEQHMAENSEPSSRLAQLRATLRDRLEQALAQLHAAADDERQRIERNTLRAAALKREHDRAESALEGERGVLKVKMHDQYLQRSALEQQEAEVSMELASHDESRRRHNRVLDDLQRAADGDVALMREAKKSCLRAQDKIRLHWSQFNYESALAKISSAKERAATMLDDATARAVIQDQSQRVERQQRKTAHLGPLAQQQQRGGGGGGGHMQQQNNSAARSHGSLSSQQLKRVSGSRRERETSVDSQASQRHAPPLAVRSDAPVSPAMGPVAAGSDASPVIV